jgi:HlyD family secretion protein
VEIVFSVDKGKAIARQVRTGIQSDSLIEILEGLDQGEEIVIGSYRAISKDLENGAMVTISKQPAKPDAATPRGS